MSARAWDHRLWGITLSTGTETLAMLGTGWDPTVTEQYAGEPSRPLLFTTRWHARAWCAAHSARQPSWRFRPMRVRRIFQAC